MIALTKVRHAPYAPGGEGHTTYLTKDGRFDIRGGYGRGWPNNTFWQVRTTDGSTPFRGLRGPKTMSIENFETLRDVREALEDIYAAESVEKVAS